MSAHEPRSLQAHASATQLPTCLARSEPALLERLNPAFLRRHGVAPVGVGHGRLLLAMMDASDGEAIAALRFATGLDIEPVAMSRDEVLELIECRNESLASDAAEFPARDGYSLAGRLAAWLRGETAPWASLAPLAELLAVGARPGEAAAIIVEQIAPAGHADANLIEIVQRLTYGADLATSIRESAVLPRWFADCLNAAPTDQVRAFASIVKHESSLAEARAQVRWLLIEIALWTTIAAATWAAVSPLLALGLVAVGVFGLVRTRVLQSDDRQTDLMRAHVLNLLGTLTELGVGDATALQCALARCQFPTPEGAVGVSHGSAKLATVLQLPALESALIGRETPGRGAVRAAHICMARVTWTIARTRALVRGCGLAAFAVGMIVQVA